MICRNLPEITISPLPSSWSRGRTPSSPTSQFCHGNAPLAHPNTSDEVPEQLTVKRGNRQDSPGTNLPALLLGNLVAFLDGLLPAFLGRLLPALGVGHLPKYIKGLTLTFRSTYVDAHFMRDRYTALLGHLMAGLVRNVLALGVRHSGADFVGCSPALGVRDLLAVLHRQLLAPL